MKGPGSEKRGVDDDPLTYCSHPPIPSPLKSGSDSDSNFAGDTIRETNHVTPDYIAGQLRLPQPFGRYEIKKTLGQGGMGAVFLAQDTQLNRPVALKVPFLSGDQSDLIRLRFIREAQAVAAVRHSNICPIYDIGEFAEIPYISMGYIDGEPLSKRIEAANKAGIALNLDTALNFVRKIALALHEAHRSNVIHRDLKPANIMIDRNEEPIVMDFGLARRDDLPVSALTVEGDLMGTPYYMPPEQARGKQSEVGPGSDIYSLGIVFYECLTGSPPFKGNFPSVLVQHMNDAPVPPSRRRPELDPRLDEVCLKAVAKNPGHRYPCMRTFATALQDVRNAIFAPRSAPHSVAQSVGQSMIGLTLRIEGTKFAYRPSPNQTSIALGRQKRKPSDPPGFGNDIVLRVPGDDIASIRISRKHCEIRRDTKGYVLIDHSKTGTIHNGQEIPRETPVRLKSGDRLVIAGVITLVVKLHSGSSQPIIDPEVALPNVPGFLEAAVGDMVTMDWDEDEMQIEEDEDEE